MLLAALVISAMTYTVEPDLSKPILTNPKETPRRRAGRLCPDEVKRPHNPKHEPKDVRILPYCEPNGVKVPSEPTPQPQPRRVEK
jgi:hypothetical protein